MPIDMTGIGGTYNQRPPTPTPRPGPGGNPDAPVNQMPYASPMAGGGTDWNKPSWMQGNPYLKFGAEGAGQPWWRDPKGGYHTVWNPYWGWQDKLAVQKQYKTGEGGWTPTQEQFEGWGFTQQPGETPGGWEEYFPGRLTKATDPGFQPGGGGGGELAAPTSVTPGQWPDMQNWLQGPGYTSPVTAPEFQYPQELDLASQVLGDFAWTGMPTDIPDVWNFLEYGNQGGWGPQPPAGGPSGQPQPGGQDPWAQARIEHPENFGPGGQPNLGAPMMGGPAGQLPPGLSGIWEEGNPEWQAQQAGTQPGGQLPPGLSGIWQEGDPAWQAQQGGGPQPGGGQLSGLPSDLGTGDPLAGTPPIVRGPAQPGQPQPGMGQPPMGGPPGQPQPGGFGGLREMFQTGMPTSQTEWYQKAKGIAQQDIMDQIAQAAESAGLEGRRWSQSMGRSAQDISGRTMGRFGLGALERELGALESARGRQMQTAPLLYQLGMGGAGLEEAAKGRGMQAAGMLPGIAQMRQQMPLQAAGAAMGAGGQMQQMIQQMISPLYQEWQRTQPEASPWWQLGMGTAGLPGQMVPQQYQPSGFQSGFGGLLSLLPFLGML